MSHHYQDRDWMQEFVNGPAPVVVLIPFESSKYVQRVSKDCIDNHHESPYVIELSDDTVNLVKQFITITTRTVVYMDYGVNSFMKQCLNHAIRVGKTIDQRLIGKE